jgi:hypothetical protein
MTYGNARHETNAPFSSPPGKAKVAERPLQQRDEDTSPHEGERARGFIYVPPGR